MGSEEKVRRFVSYRPNAQVLSFFRDLKKRNIPAPTAENVAVSSQPIPKSGPSLKRRPKKKTTRSSSDTAGGGHKSTERKKTQAKKKKKGVDKRLQRVKL